MMLKERNSSLQFKCIHHFIEDWANLEPNKLALSYNEVNLTYNQINTSSNQLAHYLLQRGVKKGDAVGISVSRSLNMVIGLIAIMKTGAAYIPIDIDYPSNRINHMINDSQLHFLLTEQELIKKINYRGNMILLNDVKNFESQSSDNLTTSFNSTDLAYILYTSGTTGKPKGVMISHGNLVNAYFGWLDIYQLSKKDSHLQMANFSFDVFTGDTVRALCSGGRLVICPRELLLQPSKLFALMFREKITFAEFVPTVVRGLIEYAEHNDKLLNFMRLIVCGSDNWCIGEYSKLQNICGDKTRVISSYGVTEATIDSTYFEDTEANRHFEPNHIVPIGKPFPGTQAYILNEDQSETKEGELGEIYIGGESVALGYFNKPNLTRQKFISCRSTSVILYRTGDLGKRLPDGNIEFHGRIDNQVKLRGIRVELSDIENTINCYPTVRESLVLLSNDQEHKKLVAYIVFEEDCVPHISNLRIYLKEKLPSYMLPSHFIKLKTIPLTPNGKLDRNALSNISTEGMSVSNTDEPRDKIESDLIILWSKVLDVSEISILDHFEDLGGNSFLFARLCQEVEKHFLIKIQTSLLVNNLTVKEQAKLIKRKLRGVMQDL